MASETNDRLTFWRGWWEGSRFYPDAQRLAIYDAIFAFAFDGAEPAQPQPGDLDAAIIYDRIAHIRATIEISRKRRQSGALGGSKREANAKQTPSKRQAKRKQTQANAKQREANRNQEQVKEQDKEQDKEHTATPARTREKKQPPTLDQFLAGAALAGVPEAFARPFYTNLVAAGWRDADDLYVANWRRYLKKSYTDEVQKNLAARVIAPSLDDFKIAR